MIREFLTLTSIKTIEKDKNVAGSLTVQNGAYGSLAPVIMFTRNLLEPASRAKYRGLGCSDCAVYPVIPQRCAIEAEYLFHSARNRVCLLYTSRCV